jgi:hypothetical protein
VDKSFQSFQDCYCAITSTLEQLDDEQGSEGKPLPLLGDTNAIAGEESEETLVMKLQVGNSYMLRYITFKHLKLNVLLYLFDMLIC